MVPFIYVLETEEGKPPRALVGQVEDVEEVGEMKVAKMAVFSPDTGCWTIDGIPVPDLLGEAITMHARSLGVEAFLDRP